MSGRHRIHAPVAAALAALGIAVAGWGPLPDAGASARAQGMTMRACSGEIARGLSIHVHRVHCTPALRLVNAAAHADRACPKGWRARPGTLLRGIRRGSGTHRVTLCQRGRGDARQAFTYHLPLG